MKQPKKKDAAGVIKARSVVLTPLSADELRAKLENNEDPGAAYLAQVIEAVQSDPDNLFWNTLWEIKNKKGTVGYLRFTGAPKSGSAELEIALCEGAGERDAAAALRAASRRAFAAEKQLYLIEAWLNRHLGAVRILERAGFERAFESEGLVRYEKKRRRISFLALFFVLFILAGVAVGYFVGDYPLCVAIGICLAILPGALLDKAAAQAQTTALEKAKNKNGK